jgi:hypothetical protein
MQAIQLPPTAGLRRWCRACGLPSPVASPGCLHCGQMVDDGRVRVMSPIFSDNCGVVQNNVLNIDAEGLLEALSDDEDPAPQPAPHRESFLWRFFMLTCSLAMWCGILTFVSITAVIIWCVVLAVMKAHG